MTTARILTVVGFRITQVAADQNRNSAGGGNKDAEDGNDGISGSDPHLYARNGEVIGGGALCRTGRRGRRLVPGKRGPLRSGNGIPSSEHWSAVSG